MNPVAAALFLIFITDGTDVKIDMDCGTNPITWNATTKQAACAALVVDAKDCEPSNAIVTADNVHIVCTKSANLKVSCPGATSNLGKVGNVATYYCEDGLRPPAQLRVITDNGTAK